MRRFVKWLVSTVSSVGSVPLKLLQVFNRRHVRSLPTSVTANSCSSTLNPSVQIAAVELGGTTCVAALARSTDPTNILDVIEVPTTTPADTLATLTKWLDERTPFAVIGIASFGPVDLDPNSDTYGFITTTPKPNWAHCNLLSAFQRYNVPIAFDTDVNAPALAELTHGSHGTEATSCAYITVGTGIGVGLVVNGAPVHGLMHPEGGHIMPARYPGDDYEGFTRLHPLSVESMAAAKACAERCSVEPKDLPNVSDDHPAWDAVAYYLAQLCLSIMFLVSPHVIVLSGGVMRRQSLFPRIRSHFCALNDGYVDVPKIRNHLEKYIVPSTFGDDSGIIGALELARRQLNSQ